VADDNKFTWGLRPGGDDDEPVEPAVPGQEEPIDQGYFVALNSDAELVAPSATNDRAPSAADYDTPTQAFDLASANAYTPPDYNSPDYPRYDEAQHDPVNWVSPPVDVSLHGAIDAVAAQPVGLEHPAQESTPVSALDSLFGEKSFQEYDSTIAAGSVPFGASQLAIGASGVAEPPRPPRPPLARGPKALIWVAASLVAVLALMGLFVLGTQLAPVLSPEPVVTPTPTPSSTVDPFAEILGPVAPGVYRWDELLGTECVDPYTSAWEQEFTVVDCAAPHPAQLVFRGEFTDSVIQPYPGVTELQARMNLLCTAATNIDYPAAKAYGDIQFSASFAGDENEWIAGSRGFFCFVNRSGGEPLAGSVAMPDAPTPWVKVVPEPEP
jgi:hypothetical protein